MDTGHENSPRGKRNPSFQADEFDLKDLPGIQFSLSKKALSYPLVDSNYTKAVHYHLFRVKRGNRIKTTIEYVGGHVWKVSNGNPTLCLGYSLYDMGYII